MFSKRDKSTISRVRVNISLSEQIPLSILESKNIQYMQHCEKKDDALEYACNKNPNQPALIMQADQGFCCPPINSLKLNHFMGVWKNHGRWSGCIRCAG